MKKSETKKGGAGRIDARRRSCWQKTLRFLAYIAALRRRKQTQTGLAVSDPCQLVWQVKKFGWLETGRKAPATPASLSGM